MTAPAGRPVRDWVLCVAGANACLVRIWTDLLAHDPWPAHRGYGPPSAHHYAAAMALTLLLGTVMWAVLRARGGRLARYLFFGACAALLAKEAFLAVTGLGWFGRGSLITWGGALSAGALALGTAWLLRWLAVRGSWVGRRLASALVPLILVTFGNSLWRMSRPAPPEYRCFDHSRGPARQGLRAVWIILDEIDEDVAFASRPTGLVLPELDRFRAQAAFVAARAESPANATAISIPELTGVNRGPDDSVFARARRAGLRSGITGWAVPYCELFRASVETCAWWPMAQQHNTYGTGFGQVVGRMGISLFESNQLSPFGQTLAVRDYVKTVGEMAASAEAMATRADLDLVYLHLSPPHNPYVYNPATGQLDAVPRRLPNPAGYLRNLQLADRVFGGIRRAMEKAGLWERSIVVVTGDHGFRSKHLLGYPKTDRHVPFLVKSPRPVGLDPAAPLETVRTGDLVLEWLGVPKS